MRALHIAMCDLHQDCVSVKDGVTTTHYTDVTILTIDFSLTPGRARSETSASIPDSSIPRTGTGIAADTEGRALKDTALVLPTELRTHPDSDPRAVTFDHGSSQLPADFIDPLPLRRRMGRGW